MVPAFVPTAGVIVSIPFDSPRSPDDDGESGKDGMNEEKERKRKGYERVNQIARRKKVNIPSLH